MSHTIVTALALCGLLGLAANANGENNPTQNQNKPEPLIQKKTAAGLDVSRKKSGQDKNHGKKHNNRNQSQPRYRKSEPEISKHAHAFELHSIYTHLNTDYDGDGYYSDFSLSFDADFSHGHADVFAELYIRKAGGAWRHYHTTDVFGIYADSTNDEYTVRTRLKFDFPTGSYDLLIDLYEAGYNGIIATAGPVDDTDLYALPLEDKKHELGATIAHIDYIRVDLQTDNDHDGFYSTLTIAYRINTVATGAYAFTEITLIHPNELSRQTIATDIFALHNQTEINEISLNSGYTAAHYDIELKLIDYYSGDILAVAAQDYSSLTRIPLESANHDAHYDYPDNVQPHIDTHDSVSTSEFGGGSLDLGVLLLILITISRYLQRTPRQAKGFLLLPNLTLPLESLALRFYCKGKIQHAINPPPSRLTRRKRPPCASMISRHRGKPKPVPDCLVE